MAVGRQDPPARKALPDLLDCLAPEAHRVPPGPGALMVPPDRPELVELTAQWDPSAQSDQLAQPAPQDRRAQPVRSDPPDRVALTD